MCMRILEVLGMLPVQHEQACGTLGYTGVAERTTGYSGPYMYVLQNRSVSTDAKGVVRNNKCHAYR